MRYLALLVVAWLLACGGARPVATALVGGDTQSPPCGRGVGCGDAGGQGSLLVPTAVIGASAVGIAAIAYVYHLVSGPARVPVPTRHSVQ